MIPMISWACRKTPRRPRSRRPIAHYGVGIDVLTGDAPEPASRDMQIDRIHRDLDDLSDRDRAIVEQMVGAMKQNDAKAG